MHIYLCVCTANFAFTKHLSVKASELFNQVQNGLKPVLLSVKTGFTVDEQYTITGKSV